MKSLTYICWNYGYCFCITNTWWRVRQGTYDSSSSSETEENTCTEEVPNKVKATKYTLLKLNEEYYDKSLKAQVIKANETYNRLAVDYKIKKDFPSNVQLEVEVYRSNLNSDKYCKIRDFVFPLCGNKTGKYDKYLREDVLEAKKSGECIEKGQYSICDVGYFKFYELLSDKELKNAKFKMIRSVVSGHVILSSDEIEFVSNLK